MVLGGHVHAGSLGLGQPLRGLRRGWNLASKTFQRHPFLVKTLTSGVGFAFGDALAQVASRSKGEPYDWPRTAKMAAAGWVVAGPLGHLALSWMNLAWPVNSRLVVTTKITVDQVLGCALWHAALLAAHEPYRKAAQGLADSARRQLGGARQELLL